MNNTYKLVWDLRLQAWRVASELARGHKKTASTGLAVAALLTMFAPAYAAPAIDALPAGEQIASGRASLNRLIAGRLVINQHSDKLITNWNSFDIGANASVIFKQPDANSIALNRITTGTASQIFGKLDANGQVFIVNPAGITFGAGSQVSVGGLLASTLNIQDSDFLGGDLRFVRDRANGKVSNEGSLNASAGNVVLLSPTILSQGSISANAGNLFIVSADGVRVQDNNAIVLQAPLSASVVRQSGILSATSLASGKGKILLIADKNHARSDLKVQGTINAQNSWIKGKNMLIAGNLTVQGNAALDAAGYIEVNGTANFLPDTVNGQQRLLSLSFGADDLIYSFKSPAINLPGGASQTLRVNGKDYKVISSLSQLQAIGQDNSALAGRYALGIDIDARDSANWNNGAGFSPIGNNTLPFSGELYGLKHVVSGLTINRPTEDRVALFGYVNGATIQGLQLKDVNIKGYTDVAALAAFSRNSNFAGITLGGRLSGKDRVGMLSGFNIDSTIRGAYFSGLVEATGLRLGGLVGYNRGGLIDNAGGFASVRGISSPVVGGLIGYSENAVIQNSGFSGGVSRTGAWSVYPQAGVGGLVGYLASGEIRNSSTLVGINSEGALDGGLVGVNNGTIADSYTFGTFGLYNGRETTLDAGLVATNNGLIQRSYSTARVSGAGLVYDNNGTIEDSYYKDDQLGGKNALKGFRPSGLAVYNSGLIQRSYVQANMQSTDKRANESFIGGLVGINYKTGVISDSWVQGDVISTAKHVGGLVGGNWGTLKNSHMQGNVTGVYNVGGAVGINYAGAVVDTVQANAAVNGQIHIGGLVGLNNDGAFIRNGLTNGSVFASYFYLPYYGGDGFFDFRPGGEKVGGLVGANLGQIDQSASLASVTGGITVGGLVGYNVLYTLDGITRSGVINDSFATGAVNGVDIVGGLVGNNEGIINRSYAAGSVTGRHSGGLAGFANVDGEVNSSYWNVASVGKGQSSGGKALTDALSKQKRMYAGWDISSDPTGNSIWYINEGVAMPVLRSLMQP